MLTPKIRPLSIRHLALALMLPLQEIVYEDTVLGVAVYGDCLTDNKGRTAADVRSAFTLGGNLEAHWFVAFQFERKEGSIAVDKVVSRGEEGC